MSESSETSIAVPQRKEAQLSSSEEAVYQQLQRIIGETPADRLMREQERVAMETNRLLYKNIFSPDYQNKPLIEQSEKNRQILLWAIEKHKNIPSDLFSQDGYSNLPTKEILQRLFSSEEIKQLHGMMVYQVGKGIKNLDPVNTIVMGGIIYSQSPISKEDDHVIMGLFKKAMAVPGHFNEPGVTPPFLRKNVRGYIHVLPYGVAEKIPGKERETLLMLTDDLITLFDFLENTPGMGYPRFIMNATNSAMGEVAKKYMGAQVATEDQADKFALSLGRMMRGRDPFEKTNVVQVFLPEAAIKEGKRRLLPLRDRLARIASHGENIPLSGLLRQFRIDALDRVTSKISFVDLYKQQLKRAAF